jgi:SAM-dependent methyltransferase
VNDSVLSVPSKLYRGNLRKDEEEYLASARWLLDWLPGVVGRDDLADVRMLDIGCGTKFTQVILGDGLPLARYAGVDVHQPLVDHLSEQVRDPRFSFHHMDTHNRMYNPDGERLTAESRLPLGEERFDLICLFSVFTHLEPHDYPNMLRMLRHQVAENGSLVYSLFLDQPSAGGHGLLDQVCRKLGVDWVPNGERFFDGRPDKPLYQAIYARDYALELVDGTGWDVEKIIEPEPYVQHAFLCRPV